MARKPLCLLLVGLLLSCSPYKVKQHELPDTSFPETFTADSSHGTSEVIPQAWWRLYNDPDLTRIVDQTLESNHSLEAAWQRLMQVREQAVVTGSERYPQVTLESGATRTRIDNEQSGFSVASGGFIPEQEGDGFKSIENDFFVRSGLSFEIDLWKRITSSVSAAEFRAEASAAELQEVALTLAGSATELWLTAQEQQALLSLLSEQIGASKKQLELIELRFSVGKGTALDVLQQRQQVASLQAELPDARRRLAEALHQVAVLTGQVPGTLKKEEIRGLLPELPEFPTFVRPIDLLESRPDLKALQLRLQGAEYDLASAVADRFPRLTVGLSYEFSAETVGSGFTAEVGRMFGEAALPLVDGGRRRAVVRGNESRVRELESEFAQKFLEAIGDVETALVAESMQQELRDRLQAQLKHARATLRESQSRYISGLSDYVNVLVSLQGVQVLERRLVTVEKNLLIARSRLYRAFGGNVLTPASSRKSVDKEIV